MGKKIREDFPKLTSLFLVGFGIKTVIYINFSNKPKMCLRSEN